MPTPIAAPIISHTEISPRAPVNYALSRAIAEQLYLIRQAAGGRNPIPASGGKHGQLFSND